MPKKKRAFTRTIRQEKSSLQSDNNDEEHTSPAMADTDTAGSRRNITTHHGASQNPFIAELTGELKRNHDELASYYHIPCFQDLKGKFKNDHFSTAPPTVRQSDAMIII